jgi:hypothetical protein
MGSNSWQFDRWSVSSFKQSPVDRRIGIGWSWMCIEFSEFSGCFPFARLNPRCTTVFWSVSSLALSCRHWKSTDVALNQFTHALNQNGGLTVVFPWNNRWNNNESFFAYALNSHSIRPFATFDPICSPDNDFLFNTRSRSSKRTIDNASWKVSRETTPFFQLT